MKLVKMSVIPYLGDRSESIDVVVNIDQIVVIDSVTSEEAKEAGANSFGVLTTGYRFASRMNQDELIAFLNKAYKEE